MFNLYPLRNPNSPQTIGANLNGQTLSFDLDRSGLIHGLDITIEGDIGTAAATASVGGLFDIIQNVRLAFTLTNGGSFTPINGLTGSDLAELSQFKRGIFPRVVGSLGATGQFRITIPIDMVQYGWSGQLASTSSAQVGNVYPRFACSLPAYACSTATLSFSVATQNQLDSNGTPTLVVANVNAFVTQRQVPKTLVPTNMYYAQNQLDITEFTNLTTGTNNQYNLAAGGYLTLALIRSFSATNVKQADGTVSPFTSNIAATAAPTQLLQMLDTQRVPKVDGSFQLLRDWNYEAIVDTLITGNACFQYNRSQNQAFNTSGLVASSTNQIPIIANITAAANSKIRVVTERVFDPQGYLQIG